LVWFIYKRACLQIGLECLESLFGVLSPRECPLGKLGNGLFLFLMLSSDLILDTFRGPSLPVDIQRKRT